MAFGLKIATLLGTAALTAANAGEPFPPSTSKDWQWVPIVGSKCMNGEETGVHVRYSQSGSKKVGIYLNGGGACFNEFTCVTCAAANHPRTPDSNGIFSTDKSNPLEDFNWINVPYCTGDVHLGLAEKRFALDQRSFNGHGNLMLIVERAFASWPVVDTLFVTGESAGGFGALGSYPSVRSHWNSANGNADIRAIMVDDSGPIMDDEAIPVCLQEEWRTIWNINASFPAGCPCVGDKGNIVAAWSYGRKLYPKDSFGLVSSVADGVISSFFSFSLADCRNPLPVGYNKLEAGLKRLAATGVPVYMIPGATHTHTSSNEFFTRTVNNTKLYEWVGQLIGTGPDPGSVMPSTEDAIPEDVIV